MALKELIAVGRVVKSAGVRGEIRVEALTDRLERFRSLREVRVGKSDVETVPVNIEGVRFTGSHVFLKLKGVDDRNAADALRGSFVYVETAQAELPSESSYFIHEIIGMTVETEDGRQVGTVTDVRQLPASDVWSVDVGGREVLIPAVKAIVRNVDRERRRIVINAIEGLLE